MSFLDSFFCYILLIITVQIRQNCSISAPLSIQVLSDLKSISLWVSKHFQEKIWINIKFERNLRVKLRIFFCHFWTISFCLWLDTFQNCFDSVSFKIEVSSILFPKINRFVKIFSSYSEPLIHQLFLWTVILD